METLSFETLKINDEIRALMARYVYLADQKDWVGLSTLFTPEGTFTPMDVSGHPLVEMKGREQIAMTISGSVGRATAIHHLFSYEVKVLSPNKAEGVFAMEDYLIRPEDEMPEKPVKGEMPVFRTLHGFGHYHGQYTRIDGIWNISELVQTRLKLDFTY